MSDGENLFGDRAERKRLREAKELELEIKGELELLLKSGALENVGAAYAAREDVEEAMSRAVAECGSIEAVRYRRALEMHRYHLRCAQLYAIESTKLLAALWKR